MAHTPVGHDTERQAGEQRADVSVAGNEKASSLNGWGRTFCALFSADFLLLSLYYFVLTHVLRGPFRVGHVEIFLLLLGFVLPTAMSILLTCFYMWRRLPTFMIRATSVFLAAVMPIVAIASHLAARCFVMMQCA
jgi:hypothetical protein